MTAQLWQVLMVVAALALFVLAAGAPGTFGH
jgi:hypothetical protein